MKTRRRPSGKSVEEKQERNRYCPLSLEPLVKLIKININNAWAARSRVKVKEEKGERKKNNEENLTFTARREHARQHIAHLIFIKGAFNQLVL